MRAADIGGGTYRRLAEADLEAVHTHAADARKRGTRALGRHVDAR